MRAARSLPMPGISRSPVTSSVATSWGWLAIMSAPFRYARILNGLSSLISRRSAISRRMRATAALSNPEAFRFDPVVEQARAAPRQRLGDGCPGGRRAVAEQAASAAGAAHLGGGGAGRLGALDQVVDRGGGDAGRKAFAILPLLGDLIADLVPVLFLKGVSHRRSR